MDPEQTFIRVQERFSQMLTPRIRASLEYTYLFVAITLFCILVVMHANFVQQPGCSSELAGVETTEAQLIQIKITSAGLWSQSESENNVRNTPVKDTAALHLKGADVNEEGLNFLDAKFWLNWISSVARREKLTLKLWNSDNENFESQSDTSIRSEGFKPAVNEAVLKINKDESCSRFPLSAKESFRAAIFHLGRKWYGRLSFLWRHAKKILGSLWASKSGKVLQNSKLTMLRYGRLSFLWRHAKKILGSLWARKSGKVLQNSKLTMLQYGRLSFLWRHAKKILGSLWDIAGIHLNLDILKWLHILHLDRLNSFAVRWLEKRSKTFEPTYLYTLEKGYFLLPEGAKLRHNIRTINISFSARHSCFGNRWQQLLINRLVGYDTILMNSFLNSPGQGYLYNYQTKEFYNLTHVHEQPEVSVRFGDYLATKCGVLMMSLFVFFTTTMSVSFTLRETQTRMLKFTVQLQHHAQHRLPTFQLIFVHVIESLVFVPIMIGILFFLFEFYDDHLLAFMVLILVWLCELFTLISVRTPISMKFFPRFFLLYFLVFHIYFFSYTYGFSYLALSTTAAFMQHLILYFWNRFEVPALQRFMLNRRSNFPQHPDFHITSSAILASTLHITRVNNRNPGPANIDLSPGPGLRGGPDVATTTSGTSVVSEQHQRPENQNSDGLGHSPQIEGRPALRQEENGANPVAMNSFCSMLLWLLGGVYSESFNSILSIFRDGRGQGHVFAESPRPENPTAQSAE